MVAVTNQTAWQGGPTIWRGTNSRRSRPFWTGYLSTSRSAPDGRDDLVELGLGLVSAQRSGLVGRAQRVFVPRRLRVAARKPRPRLDCLLRRQAERERALVARDRLGLQRPVVQCCCPPEPRKRVGR